MAKTNTKTKTDTRRRVARREKIREARATRALIARRSPRQLTLEEAALGPVREPTEEAVSALMASVLARRIAAECSGGCMADRHKNDRPGGARSARVDEETGGGS